jgi:hypothetical protein
LAIFNGRRFRCRSLYWFYPIAPLVPYRDGRIRIIFVHPGRMTTSVNYPTSWKVGDNDGLYCRAMTLRVPSAKPREKFALLASGVVFVYQETPLLLNCVAGEGQQSTVISKMCTGI